MKILDALRPRFATTGPLSPVRSRFVTDPDAPLLQLNREGDCLTIGQACEGIFVVGGTGSGKSSGSGAALAQALLRTGAGGLVLCVKAGEAERWIEWLRACGRLDDLIRVQPGSRRNFNFIDHELRRLGGLGADPSNIVALLMTMVGFVKLATGQSSQEEATFWVGARQELLENSVEPLIAATGRCRLDELMRFITSAPTRPEDMQDPEWQKTSYWWWVMEQAHDAPRGPALSETSSQVLQDYWLGTMIRLDAKTRSNIVVTVTATISPFLRGVLREAFCTDTTVVPELTHEGAVIIVDYPVKTTGIAGSLAGTIWKHAWQRATEARAMGSNSRLNFLYVDEAQLFMSPYDKEFQSTARGSLVATIYLTQNLPNYYALQPAKDAKAATDGLLGNFQTKIFHTNTDPTTNQYAADLIGKDILRRANGNWSSNSGWSRGDNEGGSHSYQKGTNKGRQWGSQSGASVTYTDTGNTSFSLNSGSSGGGQKGENSSWSRSRTTGTSRGESGGLSAGGGWSEQMDYVVPPSFFASGLRKGGAAHGFLVDGVLVQGGRRFRASGSHSLFVTFQQ